MDRITAANATEDNLFQDGNPSTGQPATSFNAAWANGVQEELMNIIEEGGLAGSAVAFDQVMKAMINLTHQIGDHIITSNDELTPNQRYPWQTWAEDTSGRVIVSRDLTQVEFDQTGKTGGAKTHTLTQAQLPNINIGIPVHEPDDGSGAIVAATPNGNPQTGTMNVSLGGEGQAHNILQPFIVRRVWVRTA